MRQTRFPSVTAFVAGIPLLCALSASIARAEPNQEIRLMGEQPDFTRVIDAFDDDDDFDLDLSLTMSRTSIAGTIQREVPDAAAGSTGVSLVDVARHQQTRYTATLGLDMGIYKDLALYGRLPFVIQDQRSLSTPAGGSSGDTGNLFSVPFTSPNRTGLDYLGLGIAWGVLNQRRNAQVSPSWVPTLVLMAEGRFGLGQSLRPCNANPVPGQDSCPLGGGAGLSRGTNALRLETRASWRYHNFEPYWGLAYQAEWAGIAKDIFLPAGSLPGIINKRPPQTVEMTAGNQFIVWEDREDWQRFDIDLRAIATYKSEGLDYSPLFDALGTSTAPGLTRDNQDGVPTAGRPATQVPFYGLTDNQAYGSLMGRVAFKYQASSLIKFGLGLGLGYSLPRYITFTDACNPGVTATPGDPRIATCRAGITNPNYRPDVDTPGSRFKVNGEVLFDVAGNATLMF